MEPSGFGGRLRDLRATSGLTQQQLADAAGVAKATVADLEQGRYEPSWPMALALARALGVEVTAFVPDPAAPPGEQTERKRGRPRKAEASSAAPAPAAGGPRARRAQSRPGGG
jgi:putative transcriptional regulator